MKEFHTALRLTDKEWTRRAPQWQRYQPVETMRIKTADWANRANAEEQHITTQYSTTQRNKHNTT